ncbi:hypothetical protein INT45_006412 [Circinella minor]|uniref:Uncharacterized protein n=1 Tax=Circinella minor TaxID=1195481 RepID=A0A8H7SCH4_9FUNG|nr:hypothetical protein INT45_006412 [Circinella minor]
MQQRLLQPEHIVAQSRDQPSAEPLFFIVPTTMLTGDERRKFIDQYPNIESLQYQPPDMILTAA